VGAGLDPRNRDRTRAHRGVLSNIIRYRERSAHAMCLVMKRGSGGGNTNLARGFGSTATQSTTTLGGTAFGRGTSITNGGFNSNLAAGKFSSADQQVVTLGGTAGRRGLNVVDGGANKNAALGFGSSASQQVFTGAQ
jgi:hypothetical protein